MKAERRRLSLKLPSWVFELMDKRIEEIVDREKKKSGNTTTVTYTGLIVDAIAKCYGKEGTR